MFHYKKLKLSKVYFILCNIYQKKPKRKYTEILTEMFCLFKFSKCALLLYQKKIFNEQATRFHNSQVYSQFREEVMIDSEVKYAIKRVKKGQILSWKLTNPSCHFLS